MNNLFAQVEPAVGVPNVSLIIGALLLVAVVLGGSTILIQRNKSWKAGLTQSLGSLLWASPVIAVLAFVGVRVAPQFQFGTETRAPQDAKPTWLESDRQIKEVESFKDPSMLVSTEADASADDSLPAWTSEDVLRLKSSGNKLQNAEWRVITESGWHKSVDEARADALNQAAKLVQEDFSQFYAGGSAIPKEAIKDRVFRAEAVQKQVHEYVVNPFTMYKVYWQVELSPEVRQELSGTWKQEVATQRAWLVGIVLALLTLISASFAAYFHLDTKTNGAHRFRLKLAAAALMTAGGLGVLAVLPYV